MRSELALQRAVDNILTFLSPEESRLSKKERAQAESTLKVLRERFLATPRTRRATRLLRWSESAT